MGKEVLVGSVWEMDEAFARVLNREALSREGWEARTE